MAKLNVAQLPAKLYELLEPFSPDERVRIVQATMILFGDDQVSAATATASVRSSAAAALPGGAPSPQNYFDEKTPKSKGELLAVAARYREKYESVDTHSKADLKKVITDARRNFDDHNFARDINNAKRQAGFFNTGTGRDASKLSYYGLNFVDALPNRDDAGKLKRPGKKSKKKVSKKKSKGK